MPAPIHRFPLPGLRAWRVKRLLTQQALSDAAGTSVATVARIERGYPASALSAERLAQALGLTVAQLESEAPQ
jgi:transcriptional regulator with XRE-family HTH domain